MDIITVPDRDALLCSLLSLRTAHGSHSFWEAVDSIDIRGWRDAKIPHPTYYHWLGADAEHA